MAFYDTDRCLWCSADLHDASQYGHIVECGCGVRYDADLLKQMDRDQWESIRRRDERWAVKRDGHAVIVTDLSDPAVK